MIEINNYQEFLNVIHNNENKIVFIDFYAIWCKPCIKVMPLVEQLEKGIVSKNIIFFKVNIDEVSECVEICDIKSIPKFSLYKNGDLIESINGFDIEKIGSTLHTHLNKCDIIK
jgi:thioredoxin-like negative regulator of GroEL